MYAIDTQEKMDWLLNGLENREIILDNRKLTEEDRKEIRREIAEYKAMHHENETVIKEAVLV
ncbi:hypothetical protein R84B8_02933 [Treponema sp. R8-4-B8]